MKPDYFSVSLMGSPAAHSLCINYDAQTRNTSECIAQSSITTEAVISQDCAERVLSFYQRLVDHARDQMSYNSAGSILKASLFYSLFFLLAFAFIDTLFGNELPWASVGISAIASDVVHYVDFVSAVIRSFAVDFFIVGWIYLVIAVVCYAFVWWLLLANRKMTFWRFVRGSLAVLPIFFTLVFMSLDVLTYPDLAAIMQFPGAADIVRGFLRPLVLLPEILLAGALIGFLRVRRRKDKAVESFAASLNNEPLLEEIWR